MWTMGVTKRRLLHSVLVSFSLLYLASVYYHWRLRNLKAGHTKTLHSGTHHPTKLLLDTLGHPHVISKDSVDGDKDALSWERTGYKFVIGVPTVHREQFDYHITSMYSLLNGIGIKELQGAKRNKKFVIVVQVGDSDSQVAHKRALVLKERYGGLIQNGNMEIIQPSRSWYKGLHGNVTGNTRSKQVLDYAHLMLYSATKGDYYLHLEDDCLAERGFLSKLEGFLSEVDTNHWLSLDFSGIGFLGKLFKTQDLFDLVGYFLKNKADGATTEDLFQEYMNNLHGPCDLSSEKVNSHCMQVLGLVNIQYRPSLFKHTGAYPSVPTGWDSATPSRDPNSPVGFEPYPWEDVPIYLNPKAKLWTSMKELDGHHLKSAYNLNGYFMVEKPKAGDVVFVNFTPPVVLEEFFLRSWHSGHPQAHFDSTTYVDVLPVFGDKVDLSGNTLFKCGYVDLNYIKVGRFNERGIAEGPLGERFGHIASVRIRVMTNHTHDALIREMVFKVQVVPTSVTPCCQPYWPDPFAGGIPGYKPLDS